MNRDGRSPKRRRRYDSRLRQEQAERTRERILAYAIEALGRPGAEDLTLADLARGAGVSEPTLYRHFGSRERLFDELEARAQEDVGLPPMPSTLEDFLEHTVALYEVFGANEALIRALSREGLAAEINARGRRRRTRLLKRMLAEHAPHLDATALERAVGALRVIVSWESFEKLTVELGMPAREAGETAAWAVKALIREVEGAESEKAAAGGANPEATGEKR